MARATPGAKRLEAGIDAVIFDMDGLLVDSEPLWQEAEMECFAAVGLDLDRDLCRRTTGLRVDDVVEYWYGRRPWDLGSVSKRALERRIVDRVVELIRERGELQPGVGHALDFFERQGLPLGLASSSYRRIIEAALEHFGLADRFDVTHSSEAEARAKPDPAVYVSTARRLGVSPARCLAVEDSRAGLSAAKAAAMRCLLVPDEGRLDGDALALADAVLSSLEELDEGVWARLRDGSAGMVDSAGRGGSAGRDGSGGATR